ncbi:hypothetical protein HPP92_006650 [Vanilla planifolia]|uniref:Uncharacterized protein n=1 Tax=Vanilla planifolia TaxID=51239 RepID=A0A835V553_VANPL|nr:hypothetical protein HPP92_006650 [Vanilla planifolia]
MAAPETDVSKTTGNSLVASEANHMESAVSAGHQFAYNSGFKCEAMIARVSRVQHLKNRPFCMRAMGGFQASCFDFSSPLLNHDELGAVCVAIGKLVHCHLVLQLNGALFSLT